VICKLAHCRLCFFLPFSPINKQHPLSHSHSIECLITCPSPIRAILLAQGPKNYQVHAIERQPRYQLSPVSYLCIISVLSELCSLPSRMHRCSATPKCSLIANFQASWLDILCSVWHRSTGTDNIGSVIRIQQVPCLVPVADIGMHVSRRITDSGSASTCLYYLSSLTC